MQLWTLKDIAGPLAIVLMIQVLVIIVFTHYCHLFYCLKNSKNFIVSSLANLQKN